MNKEEENREAIRYMPIFFLKEHSKRKETEKRINISKH